MNCFWRFVSFEFLILCITIDGIVANSVEANDKTPKVIVVESGANLTLPCHPSALQNLTQNETDFEWVTDNDITIFSNGRLAPFTYLGTLEPLYRIENNSLTVHNIPAINITFTCRLARLHVSYTYFIQANRGFKKVDFTERGLHIEFQKKGQTITIPCLPKDLTGYFQNASYAWVLTNKQQRSFEVISLNQRLLLRNNTANFQVTENGSLIVPNFTPNYRINYDCKISTGRTISYFTSKFDEDENVLIEKNITVAQGNDVTLNHSSDTSIFKKQTLFVGFGTRGTVLPCPAVNKNESAFSEWSLQRAVPYDNYSPTLLFLNKENFATWLPEHYEITDDRSLVIKFMASFLYGVYTCRWSTGEQYVYNVTRQINWSNHTVSVNQGENITLPCPLHDPKDREFNVIDWASPTAKQVWEFQFTDGKMLPPLSSLFTISDNVKLSDDKTSLIVSNITSNSEGDYFCYLIFSNTVYRYTVKIKDT